jgi:hypothetical protein
MPIILKSECLNFLEPSEPVQACNGIALPFFILTTVTLASTSNTLPDDGVTAPKYVKAVLMSILM